MTVHQQSKVTVHHNNLKWLSITHSFNHTSHAAIWPHGYNSRKWLFITHSLDYKVHNLQQSKVTAHQQSKVTVHHNNLKWLSITHSFNHTSHAAIWPHGYNSRKWLFITHSLDYKVHNLQQSKVTVHQQSKVTVHHNNLKWLSITHSFNHISHAAIWPHGYNSRKWLFITHSLDYKVHNLQQSKVTVHQQSKVTVHHNNLKWLSITHSFNHTSHAAIWPHGYNSLKSLFITHSYTTRHIAICPCCYNSLEWLSISHSFDHTSRMPFVHSTIAIRKYFGRYDTQFVFIQPQYLILLFCRMQGEVDLNGKVLYAYKCIHYLLRTALLWHKSKSMCHPVRIKCAHIPMCTLIIPNTYVWNRYT